MRRGLRDALVRRVYDRWISERGLRDLDRLVRGV